MKRSTKSALLIIFGVMAFSAATTFAAASEDCASQFAELDRKNAGLAKRETVFSDDVRAQIRNDGRELNSLVRQNFKNLQTEITDLVRPTIDLNPEVLVKASALLGHAQADLKRQGFKTRIEKRAAFNYFDPIRQSYIRIGERDVLKIDGGSSNSPLAREVRAFDAYVDERMKDPKFPQALRNFRLSAQLDPVMTSVSQSHGLSLSPLAAMGPGISLSPDLLVTSADDVIEILRHEKRHSKVYFDLLTDQPTPYRGRLVDIDNRGLLGIKDKPWVAAYDSYYSFDEMIGFMANVRSTQARLGKITEAFRKQQATIPDSNLTATYRAYKKSVADLRDEGIFKAQKVERLAQSTIENMRATRSVLENGSLLEFNDRTVTQSLADYPGLREVSIWLGAETSGRRFVLFVPETVAKKGLAAIRDFALDSAMQIEREASKNLAELQTRVADLARDPIERLKPEHLGPAQLGPAQLGPSPATRPTRSSSR